MTTAPTRYTIELIGSPSSQPDLQPSAGGWCRGQIGPSDLTSMQCRIQPARRVLAARAGLWKRGVGGAAGRPLSGGPAAIRPRSRSASKPSDVKGTWSHAGRTIELPWAGRLPPSRLPVGDAWPSVRIRASSATPGKAGGMTNGNRFHRAAWPPRCAPRAIRDLGVVPKSRAVPAGPSAESAPPPPIQSGDSTGRRPRRNAGHGRWIGLCMFHSDEAYAG